ncbi:MAG: DUF559 domain-containing protein [Nitriliruptoraceae bacterium]
MIITTDSPTDQLAASQYGLLTHAQLVDLGWTTSAIGRAVSSGCLGPVLAQVYRVAGSPAIPHQRMLAAVLRAGRGARLSGVATLSLLRVHGIPSDAPPYVLLPPRRRIANVPFTWVRDQAPGHHHEPLGAIPSTTPIRALVEAAARWQRRRILAVHDQLRWAGHAPEGELARAAATIGHRHRGAKLVSSLVAEGELEQDSGGERTLADALQSLGLDRNACWQEWLTPSIRVDCLLDPVEVSVATGIELVTTPHAHALGFVLEYDGHVHHEHPRDRQADAARQRAIEALGYAVLRIRAQDIRDPAALRDRLCRFLEER